MLIVQSTQCEKLRVEPGEEQGMGQHATGPTLFYPVIGYNISRYCVCCLVNILLIGKLRKQKTEDKRDLGIRIKQLYLTSNND